MTEFDKIIINDGTTNKEIYPLIETIINNKRIIFYLEEIKDNFNIEDIFIGEITSNNEIISVSEDILKESINIYDEIIETIRKV